MTLRLHAAAHDTECFPRFAIFHYEARYDGVKRTLSGRVNVRVVWIHGEKLTAILKHESKTGHHNTAAHSAIIALNQRDHVAFIISRTHVNRVTLVEHWTACLHLFCRMI